MSKCKLCGCTDDHACEGGCIWIDKRKTLCSRCAIEKKITFESVMVPTEKVIIVDCLQNENCRSGFCLRLRNASTQEWPWVSKQSLDRMAVVEDLFVFMAFYVIADSRVLKRR